MWPVCLCWWVWPLSLLLGVAFFSLCWWVWLCQPVLVGVASQAVLLGVALSACVGGHGLTQLCVDGKFKI